MDSPYQLRYLFENDERYIMEITNKGSFQENSWLVYQKLSKSFTPLTFKFMDYSSFVEERFFDEGFLKVNSETVTFIEKVSRKIETLKNLNSESFPEFLLNELNQFFQFRQKQTA